MTKIVYKTFVFVSAAALFLACVRYFYILNGMLIGSNWDQGGLWFLILKSAQGLTPNIDFVSGYPGGFEALIYLFSHILEFNFGTIRWIQTVTFSFYFFASFWAFRKLLSLPVALGAASLVTHFAYGHWVILAPGTLVQLLVIISIGCLVRKSRLSNLDLLFLGCISGAALGLKQSGIFLIVAVVSILSLRLLDLAPKLTLASRFVALLPINVPLLGYLIFRFDGDFAPFVNNIVLVPWLFSTLFLNSFVFAQPMRDYPLKDFRFLVLMMSYFLPFGLGVLALLSFFPLYYGAEVMNVLYEIFFRIPGLIDRDISVFLGLEVAQNIFLGLGGLYLITMNLQTAGQPKRRLAIAFLIGFVLVVFTDVLDTKWHHMPSSLWIGIFTFSALSVRWLAGILNNGENRKILHSNVLLRLVVFGSIICAIAWPYPSSEYLAGICAFLIILIVYHLLLNRREDIGLSVMPFVALVFAIYAYQINKAANVWVLKSNNSQLVVSGGVFHSAIVPFEREQTFLRVSNEIRHSVAKETTVAGFPNLALSLIAAGFTPVTFQGNYFGDDMEDLDTFIHDIESKQIDCIFINSRQWPYRPNFPFFPDSESIINRLPSDYKIVKTIEMVDLYCNENASVHNPIQHLEE